jgi:hypothetical protein
LRKNVVRRFGVCGAAAGVCVLLAVALPPCASAHVATRTDAARATFTRAVDACLRQQLYVAYTAGWVKDPIRSGKPGQFADVVVELYTFDDCAGAQVGFETNWQPGLDASFSTLERAVLPSPTAISLASGVVVLTDLVWTATGDVRTLVSREGDYLRTERLVDASVSGTATMAGAQFTFESGLLDTHHDMVVPR